MDLSEKQIKELNTLICQTITEAHIYGEEKLNEFYNLDNGEYINLNLKAAGFSETWRTYQSGKKYKCLAEDKKMIQGDGYAKSRPANCCRICGEVREKYKGLFFRTFYDYGETWYKVYGFNNGYCESCAKAQSDIKPAIKKELKLLNEFSYHLSGDTYAVRVQEFEGFTLYTDENKKKRS